MSLKVVRGVVSRTQRLPECEQAALYIRCFWERMRAFREAAGLRASPPGEVFERLSSQPVLPPPGPPPSLEDLRANLGL